MNDQQFLDEADKILQAVTTYESGYPGMKRGAAAIFLLRLAKEYAQRVYEMQSVTHTAINVDISKEKK